MPNTKGKGGKKKRRGKNISTEFKVDIPDKFQFFGYVTKILGSGFVNLDYYIPKLDEKSDKIIDWVKYSKIGVIRGKMRRRVWVNLNDIVLVTEREFCQNKVDIIDKYDSSQLEYLKQYSNIPPINELSENDIEFGNDTLTNFSNPISDDNKNMESFSDNDININDINDI